MKQALMLFSTVACVLGGITTANAAIGGYICSIQFLPVGGTNGQDGAVGMSVSVQPNCAGDDWVFKLCSQGATSFSCPVSTSFVYSASQLQTMFTALTQQSLANRRITFDIGQCKGSGGLNCLTHLSFRAD